MPKGFHGCLTGKDCTWLRPKRRPLQLSRTETDMFVHFDGRRIAKRGHPNTPHAGKWIALEPGFAVYDAPDLSSITIEFNGVRVQ